MTEIEKRLLASNELLRSAYQIAARFGADTNWDSWLQKLNEELLAQHKITNDLRAQHNSKEQ